MRIRALRNLGSQFPPLKEGDEADVDDAVGKAILKMGCGVQVATDVPVEIKAVPPVPELTTAVVIETAPIVTQAENVAKPLPVVQEEPTEENTAPVSDPKPKRR